MANNHHPECRTDKCYLTPKECREMPDMPSLSETALEPMSTFSNKFKGDGSFTGPTHCMFDCGLPYRHEGKCRHIECGQVHADADPCPVKAALEPLSHGVKIEYVPCLPDCPHEGQNHKHIYAPNYPRAESIILKNFERVDAAYLAANPHLKVIGLPQTGTDNIDFEAAKFAGVQIVTLQGERRFLDTISSTSEHTMGLILALSRNYKSALHGRREVGYKLSGKTLGIIGCKGRIGQQMKRLGKAFGMKVLGVDKGSRKILDLLRQSDYVTLHIPLSGNEGWWKPLHFKQMKRSAYFINTSRTRLMEDGALLQALREGWIKAAALDFCDDQELVAYALTDERLILTDHCGGNTVEDRQATDDFIQAKVNQCLSR